MVLVGSMKEQISKKEKGFEVSRTGAGIFSKIFGKISWGNSSSLELGLWFWPRGGGGLQG